MIDQTIRSEVLRRISVAEREFDVSVLLAIESGSRAWGFSSPNSDYDARFIYKHKQDWYLSVSLEEQRDVIEYPIADDIDLNGWDIRKALRLFRKSNPAFVEWIQSPIVYLERGIFATSARKLLPKVYSTANGTHHYRSMAKRNYRSYLRADLVPLKKYFYVLRPLLSVQWIERFGTAPPIEFEKLLTLLTNQPGLTQDISELLKRKRAAPELGRAPPVASIDKFIASELERLESVPTAVTDRMEVSSDLNNIFRECLAS
jgi:predicted nucleotidyltransferase